jgi:hypothetical protein
VQLAELVGDHGVVERAIGRGHLDQLVQHLAQPDL